MPDFWDAIGFVGFALLVTGVSMISIPAALIVAGLLLLTAAIRGSQGTSGE